MFRNLKCPRNIYSKFQLLPDFSLYLKNLLALRHGDLTNMQLADTEHPDSISISKILRESHE